MGLFLKKNLIAICEKKLVLFAIPTFYYVILFLRFKVNGFLLKNKNLVFGGLWFRSRN